MFLRNAVKKAEVDVIFCLDDAVASRREIVKWGEFSFVPFKTSYAQIRRLELFSTFYHARIRRVSNLFQLKSYISLRLPLIK